MICSTKWRQVFNNQSLILCEQEGISISRRLAILAVLIQNLYFQAICITVAIDNG